MRVWREEHEPEGKPLIPLRMVRTAEGVVRLRQLTRTVSSQISWGEEFDWPCARELFGSNLLVLTWIKGEPLPGDLVSDVLRGLGLERETQ